MHTKYDIQEAAIPAEFLAHAFAFLDSAKNLTGQMDQGAWPATFERGQASLWLAFHAVELFLKGCILHLDKAAKVHGHVLSTLAAQLASLKPELAFEPPFTVTQLPPSPKPQGVPIKANKDLHETFRYPVDNSGKPWPGIRAFEPSSFAKTLAELESEFERVRHAVFGTVDV